VLAKPVLELAGRLDSIAEEVTPAKMASLKPFQRAVYGRLLANWRYAAGLRSASAC